MNPTRTRGIILNKIKQALSKKKTHLQEPNFSYPIYSYSVENDLSIAFAENFIHTKGEFIFCESEPDLHLHLKILVEKKGWKHIVVIEDKFKNLIQKSTIQLLTTNSIELAEASITGCESLIARTGSILVSSVNNSGRKLTIFPTVHIVIAFTSQIVKDIDEGLILIKKKYKSGFPSMISLITGPSRTADIEKTLVYGAHGPKELILFLVDDTN
jgi:L-lactate dehydrogenase complex protein LldG